MCEWNYWRGDSKWSVWRRRIHNYIVLINNNEMMEEDLDNTLFGLIIGAV